MLAIPSARPVLPILLAAAATSISAQPLEVFDHAPEDYIGAGACAACHVEQWESQSATGHANSLSLAGEHRFVASFVPSDRLGRPPGFKYAYRAEGQGIRVDVTDQEERAGLRLEWAFGAGEQAVTFVGQAAEERYLEHHFSYYSATNSFAPTPGHRNQPAASVKDALGVYYDTFGADPTIMRCFQCHSTGPLALAEGLALDPHEPGVRCEACHGPGRRHVEAVQAGAASTVRESIDNPRRYDGDALLEFCGACHRPPASSGVVLDWSDPWNVRHQPIYLSQSACYQRSGQSLVCMDCHEPHAPLTRGLGKYDKECLKCHTATVRPAETCRQAPARACASCHMPVVTPQADLHFTNHWIGVYGGSSPLRPRVSASGSSR